MKLYTNVNKYVQYSTYNSDIGNIIVVITNYKF